MVGFIAVRDKDSSNDDIAQLTLFGRSEIESRGN